MRVYLSNIARGGVVYGQYTTAKGCSYAQRNAEFLDTALSRGILAIYHKPRGALYKLVTNVIRAVKISVLSSDIPRLSANQHSGLQPPSL